MLRAALAVAFALLVALPATASAACPRGAHCSSIAVPLSHGDPALGSLPFGYAVVPATASRTGTLVLLAGGPGQPAIPLARGITALLDPLHLSDDIVFPDMRGTGRSGAVTCKHVLTDEEIAACAAKLGDKRAYMNTTESALDLEDLRSKLGVDKLTLLGVSYGTKVAAEYARRFPQHTAAVVLDSPVPVEALDGTFALRQVAMPRVLREVCRTGPCASTVADPAAALRAAAKRLQQGPIEGPSVSGLGRVKATKVYEDTLYGALLESDGNPVMRVFLPSVIASLAKGDAAPFLHLLGQFTGAAGSDEGDGINVARLLATTCIESTLPWAPDSPVAGRVPALKAFLAANPMLFSPFTAASVVPYSIAESCLAWPPTPRPAGVPSAGPDVPVLVISGRDDLRTPLEDAKRIAAQYPHAQVLSVPRVGHSVLTSDASGCAVDGMIAFLRGRAVKPCRESRFGLGAPAYLPAVAAMLGRTRLPGRAGRSLTALRDTIAGLSVDSALASLLRPARRLRLPGLRAGYATIVGSRITLHHVEWFRGLRVDGYFDNAASLGRLTVSGPAAAAGTLLLHGSTVSGGLGGHAILPHDLN